MNNRQIKFRAWSNKYNKFMSVGFYIIGETTLFGLLNQHSIEELDTLEIQQFTGLQDSKGGDVYEGDIVLDRVSSNVMDKEMDIFTVQYDETYCAFVLKRRNRESWNWIRNISSNGQVIGNIFENPKLLK